MRPSLARLLSFSLASAAVLTVAAPLHAQSSARALIRLGGEYGGDKVAQFQYQDGSTPTVTAGGGLLFSVGGLMPLFTHGEQGLDAQVALGVKYRTIPPATNQDATWLRFPVEGLLFYRAPAGFRLGGGATMHFANKLEASGAVLNDRIDFKATPGAVLQADYTRGGAIFDVRYTAMTYEIEKGGSGRVAASSLGAGLSFLIGGAR